jgi:hypothetical protein
MIRYLVSIAGYKVTSRLSLGGKMILLFPAALKTTAFLPQGNLHLVQDPDVTAFPASMNGLRRAFFSTAAISHRLPFYIHNFPTMSHISSKRLGNKELKLFAMPILVEICIWETWRTL